jgi:hypothetical protein
MLAHLKQYINDSRTRKYPLGENGSKVLTFNKGIWYLLLILIKKCCLDLWVKGSSKPTIIIPFKGSLGHKDVSIVSH